MTNKRCAEVIHAVKFMVDDTDYTEEVEEALTMAQQMLGNADEEIDCPLHGEHEEDIWDNGYRRGYGRALLDYGLEDWGKPSEVLDKIRAKIEKLQKMCDTNDLNLLSQYSAFGMALDVIDEYRTESEDKISKIKSEYLVMDEYGYTDKELVDTANMLVDKVNELNALIQHKSREWGIRNEKM